MTIHTFNPAILREYDIRGEVGKTLFEEDAVALGKKFGIVLHQLEKKSICVGRDGRLTSPGLTKALIQGLLSVGIKVTDVGIGPTPMIYYGLKTLGVDASIMVTGSHNPSSDNGFKISLQHRPFFGGDIKEMAAVDERQPWEGQATLHTQNIADAYVQRLLQDYETSSRRLKIVWDVGNGATGDVLKELVKGIQAEHILLNDVIDGRFPAHHPDPTVLENLEQLIETVKKTKADVGIAFDGDGDRIGIVDNQGEVLWGDQLLLLLARDVIRENPGATIIADVKSSQGLFDGVLEVGGNVLMARTGHSLIKAKMAEVGALLAGEMSGHIFFADKYYGYDDALYSAVRFINILQKSTDTLAHIVKTLPTYYNTPELRIDCPDSQKFQVIEEIHQKLILQRADISAIDGVRVSCSGGWWLLRASNTQPALVARCEALSPEALEIIKIEVASWLAIYGLKL